MGVIVNYNLTIGTKAYNELIGGDVGAESAAASRKKFEMMDERGGT
jgi:hypothetical protein